MLAESNIREEYVLQEDEDGCTVAVQYFTAAWNIIVVETKLIKSTKGADASVDFS